MQSGRIGWVSALTLVLGGCVSDARVFTMEAGDSGAVREPPPEMPEERDAGRAPDSAAMGPSMEMEPELPDPTSFEDRPECEDEASVVLDRLDGIYDLAVTDAGIYAATFSGVLHSTLEGGAADLVVDLPVEHILVDEQSLYWNSGLDLNVRTHDGVGSQFLDSTVTGASQDEDAIYAVSDGMLVRIDKATRQVEPLTVGAGEGPLSESPTAVDADHVYFVSYAGPDGVSSGGAVNVERVGKDGSDRTLIVANVPGLIAVYRLRVEDGYLYLGAYLGIWRVPITGGELEPIVMLPHTTGSRPTEFVPAMASDGECLYYLVGDTVYCYSKSDGSTERVITIAGRVLNALAMHGTELYIGVGNTGPAFDLNGWIGRVSCMPGG